jgi:hypothetical protein
MVESSSSSKRKAVDEAFRRMFDYEWGTKFDIDEPQATLRDKELVRMFGVARAARILGSRGTKKRRRDAPPPAKLVDYKSILLPFTAATSHPSAETGKKASAYSAKQECSEIPSSSKIDNVLAQLAGAAKTSTVKKTSDDWESFKETDKQLQDELEKQAQGKDAYLVKKDFLLRVDNRKFEIEKEGRERERAKRITQG